MEGFEKIDEREIPELSTSAFRYTHKPSGADILLLKNGDENKVFGITFRTPPQDATGLPHILEHSVLCGSRKYPVKEPFVELLKGSLQTFLNAFTYPDKTCYPVASTHEKDFHNLVDVYLDAVFFPMLREEIFLQEGWHYHVENPSEKPEIRGVVYNEMKGAYSSPERVLAETIQQSLFPDHPYSFDSGGDPLEIPNLSYEDFVAYHKRFYHPSNSRIFFYGNGYPDAELSHIASYLESFSATHVPSSIPDLKPWTGLRKVQKKYAATPGDNLDRKTYATLNWLLPETHERITNFSLQILHHILIGTPGSPLRRALIESGLGEDLAGGGLETELRWMYFAIGLKGMSSTAIDDMVNLIEDTIRGLIRDGIPRSTVEAALNTVEFAYREGNTGNYPRGLILMLSALTTWLYDHDPLALVAFEKPINRIKDLYAENPHYFSELLEKYFLQNDRKSLVILEPDPDLLRKMEERLQAKLEEATKGWTKETKIYFLEKTKALVTYQNQPDRPEDIAKIPRLSRNDLSPEHPALPRIIENSSNPLMMLHPIQTNGIVYIDIGFKFDGMPQDHLSYLPLFCSALLEAGTTDEDYVKFTERIARHTGGIRPKLVVRNSFSDPSGVYLLLLRGKALSEKVPELLRIFRDMISKVDLNNRDRIFQIILRHKALRYQRIIPEGHRMAMRRVRGHFTLPDRVKEELSGLSQYFFVKNLADNFDKKWPEIKENLSALRDYLFKTSRMVVSVTADGDLLTATRASLERELLPEIGDGKNIPESGSLSWNFKDLPPKEAFTLPVQVHYVASGAPLGAGAVKPDDGTLLVVLNYLRTGWLWEKIRVQGGAYGAHCFFDRASGILVMTSYRDPHLEKTVDIMRNCHESISPEKLGDEDITPAVIGTFGKVDPPLFPDARAYVSLVRYLTGETEEMRRNLRKAIIQTDREDFYRAAELLRQWSQNLHLCVLGPADSIESARTDLLKDAERVAIEG
ncbi:insulinase family protein [Thermodesulforhabdus norvegica]|uniref:Peptidase M16C associated domain-containing protein n=1 Tax=Thermodesulforhabdus norvegica TaxID=39841 RepID=A0A1I4T5X9_9BACT|nr:insulinase family protein [Thermodesulforhabdus norvegica]SFM72122.1 hypothetical protein SAMN05660836_01247 [Thermodesulforhabdus norvegica]